MSLAQFADVHFAFPGKEILTGASLLIRPGDRLALLGPNGTGKSTVLKLLAGKLAADAGDARVLGRASVAYLEQSQQQTGDGTVLDALLEPFAHLRAMHDEMVQLEARLGAADPADLKRYGELQERYRIENGYDIEGRVRMLTEEVGLSSADLSRSVTTLSGGERGRLELAKVLARQPDLLLLDEPTNHLDLAAIERLEAHLNDYPGAFLVVSHDRAFIQRTCREVIELEDGEFVRYAYPYDKYVVERDARLERARVEYERQKEHVEKTENFIRKNLAGQNTKQAQSRRRMLEKLERLERPEDNWQLAGRIALRFSTGGDLGGKEIVRAPEISVGYPGKPILKNVTINIYRGDRVGIVGPNGCGKSTLVKTLVGELPPLAGTVERGAGVRLGYFDQKLSSLSEDRTAIEEIQADPQRSLARGRAPVSGQISLLRRRRLSRRARHFPAASAVAWRWPRCCSFRATSWSWTSPPTTSTFPRARRWSTPSTDSKARSSSSATIATFSIGSASASTCSRAAAWNPTPATTPTGATIGASRPSPARRPSPWRPLRA